MGKQTMGVPLHAWQRRADNKLYRLHTAQSPLTRTRTYTHLDMDNYPIGTNAVVAVLSYTVCSPATLLHGLLPGPYLLRGL